MVSYKLNSSNILQNCNYIRSIVQDRHGIIWLGSTNGLTCYDGYSVKTIHPQRVDASLLPDNRIQRLENWGNRFLFIQHRAQLYSCYDLDRGRFVDYTGNNSYKEPFFKHVLLNNNHLILFNNNGKAKDIYFYNNLFSCKKIILPNNIIDYFSTQYGDFMITSDGKIYKRQCNKNILIFNSYLFGNIGKVSEAAYFMGNIYIAANKKNIYTFSIANRQLSIYTFPSTNAHVLNDNKGNLVILSLNGINVNYITPERTYHIQNIFSDHLLRLNSDPRYNFNIAPDGRLWISSYGNGLQVYNKTNHKMTNINVKSNLIETPYIINSFIDRSGNIWVCQENMGISIIVSKNKATNYLYFDKDAVLNHTNNIKILHHLKTSFLIGNQVNNLRLYDNLLLTHQPATSIKDEYTCANRDFQNHLWIGTRNHGIFVDNTNFQHTKKINSLTKGKISDICFDSKGQAWISNFNGGIDLALKNKKGDIIGFKHFLKNVSQPRSMTKDYKGNIWLCTSEGAIVFNPRQLICNSKAYQHIHVNVSNNIDEIHCIYCDHQNRIWIGSIGNGVLMLQGNKRYRFTTADGLADNNIESIIQDNKGYIWLGTDHGISKWIKRTGTTPQMKFISFYPGINELDNACTENCAAVSLDGHIVFGTRHGILTFKPTKLSLPKSIFPLAITEININGTPIEDYIKNSLDSAIFKTKKIQLTYQQNNLTIYFSDFEYTHQHTNKFSYYLEGYDKYWSPMSSLNFATYKNLSPGIYTFHVKCINANMQNVQEATITIHITHPYWASWWAYLLYIATLSCIINFLYRNFRRINKLHNEVEVENKLTEYKLRFFTNISHEFRTPLTIIQGDMEQLRTIDHMSGQIKQSLYSMQRSVKRMMRLIDQLLEFRKLQDNKLHLSLELTDIVTFVRNIILNFSDIVRGKSINLIFLPFDKKYEIYVDRGFIDKIVYNLISNSLKYTPSKGRIIVRISLINERDLHITVEDNGVGIPKENQEKLFQCYNQNNYSHNSIGIGLYLSAELAQTHHGKILYRSNTPQGSVFELIIPTNKNVYAETDFMKKENIIVQEENAKKEEEKKESITYLEMPPVPYNLKKILIVEDDADTKIFLTQEMQKYFIIQTASDGQEGWNKLQTNLQEKGNFELVISDVIMPRMNGYELTKKIRQNKYLNQLPVILLTALTAEDKQIKGLNAGADAYIEKPFSVSILVAKCKQLLEQHNNLKMGFLQNKKEKVQLPQIITEESDKKFQNMLDIWLVKHLTDEQLNIDKFAKKMGYRRTTFYKKMKDITGYTPNEYIKQMRMNRSAELLKDKHLTIAEIGFQVGISDPCYFSRLFKAYFGITPSKYRNGKNNL
jgi:signal transduction histidine kinase/DNA-binding response OmpR family regulator/ligand-binding sensor domain-containing protein